MIYIGDTGYTVAIPGVKKIYQGSNFIGLVKSDEHTTHLVRDFTLSSAISENNVDDDKCLLTLPTNVSKSWIISNLLNVPTSTANNLKLKVKFKLIINSETPSASGISINLACCGNPNTSVNNYGNLAPDLGLYYTSSYGGQNSFIGRFPRDTGVDGGLELYKRNEGILDFNKWFTMSIETNSSNPRATLKIIDENGNTYTDTNNNAPSLKYARERVYLGFNTGYTSQDISIVYDLKECGLFSRDESIAYWTPYKIVE